MDDEMKKLLRALSEAVNESLINSMCSLTRLRRCGAPDRMRPIP